MPESHSETAPIFALLRESDEHLDGRVADTYKDQPLAQDWARVGKVIDELGEAIAALIAYTGQNPRRGVHGDQEAMLVELADVAMTAIFAIQHFTKDVDRTRLIVETKAVYIHDRLKAWEADHPLLELAP